jgi:hypothetical protein
VAQWRNEHVNQAIEYKQTKNQKPKTIEQQEEKKSISKGGRVGTTHATVFAARHKRRSGVVGAYADACNPVPLRDVVVEGLRDLGAYPEPWLARVHLRKPIGRARNDRAPGFRYCALSHAFEVTGVSPQQFKYVCRAGVCVNAPVTPHNAVGSANNKALGSAFPSKRHAWQAEPNGQHRLVGATHEGWRFGSAVPDEHCAANRLFPARDGDESTVGRVPRIVQGVANPAVPVSTRQNATRLLPARASGDELVLASKRHPDVGDHDKRAARRQSNRLDWLALISPQERRVDEGRKIFERAGVAQPLTTTQQQQKQQQKQKQKQKQASSARWK